jgi:hypothetical protein
MALSAWFARHANLRSTRDSGLFLLCYRPEGDALGKDFRIGAWPGAPTEDGRSEAEGWSG